MSEYGKITTSPNTRPATHMPKERRSFQPRIRMARCRTLCHRSVSNNLRFNQIHQIANNEIYAGTLRRVPQIRSAAFEASGSFAWSKEYRVAPMMTSAPPSCWTATAEATTANKLRRYALPLDIEN